MIEKSPEAAKGRGRPPKLERQEMLRRALMVFWRQGYETTSIGDLTEALGIGPSSLYNAFGSKEELFRRALDYYRTVESPFLAEALDSPLPAAQALQRILRQAARFYDRCSYPKGCAVLLAGANCSSKSEPVAESLRQMRQETEKAFAARIERGKEMGDVDSSADASLIAKFVMTTLQGLALQARDDAPQDVLEQLAEMACRQVRDSLAGR